MSIIRANDCGTDVAEIGLWDRKWSQDEHRPRKRPYDWAREMAAAGHAFLIGTCSDGSYGVHIYVNEPVSSEALQKYEQFEGEFGFWCETGVIIVGGSEDFGHARRVITSARDEYELAPGFYTVRVYSRIYNEDDEVERLDFLPERERTVYERYNSLMPIGCLMVLAVPVVAFLRQWWLAIALAIVAILYFFVLHVVFRRLGLDAIIHKVREQEDTEPSFYIELQTSPKLKPGGAIYIE